ncbi:MAG: hypothetical protein Q9N26_03555 [Aquificota bacterium]|nr:hypothetical protein [Aquificota bacterium]
MNESLKDLLTRCQILLEEGNFDELIKTLERIKAMDLKNLSKEEYEEALRIIEFLIKKAEDRKKDIAEKLMNLQKFKGYTR